MLLSAATLPPQPDGQWAWEVKWDGMRAVAVVGEGELRVWNRPGNDFGPAFPELRALERALGGRQAVLDGELVCFDDNGRPSFSRIRGRWLATGRTAELLARRTPATLVVFDLLELAGQSLRDQPYEVRRARLAELQLSDRHWITTAHQVGGGAALLAASREQGLEGLVAKRMGSRYRPGVRSSDWLKIKNYQRETFLIGGWLPDANGHLEALLVGLPGADGLAFVGTVEFGMQGQRGQLRELLDLIPTATATFGPRFPARRARFVQPRLKAKVRFIGRDAGVLREAILDEVSVA